MKKWSWWLKTLLVLVVLFGLVQLVPYGRDHTNPAVVAEPTWDSPATKDLAVRACYDCHSNETTWPWYSNIAPVSWLVQRDVEEARQNINFSEWPSNALFSQELMSSAAESVSEGKMPPLQFLIIHSEARLTTAEKNQLVLGFQNSGK